MVHPDGTSSRRVEGLDQPPAGHERLIHHAYDTRPVLRFTRFAPPFDGAGVLSYYPSVHLHSQGVVWQGTKASFCDTWYRWRLLFKMVNMEYTRNYL